MGRRSNGGSSSSPAGAASHGKAMQWKWLCGSCKRKHPIDHTWCNCGRCKSWTWTSEAVAGLGQLQPQQQEQFSPTWAQVAAGGPNAVGGSSIGIKELAKEEGFQGCMARLLASMESQQQPKEGTSPTSSGGTPVAPSPELPFATQGASIAEAGQVGARNHDMGNGSGIAVDDLAVGKLQKLLEATVEVYGKDSAAARDIKAQVDKAKARVGGPGKNPKSLEQQMVAQLHKLQNAQRKKSKQDEKLQSAREAATKAIAALHEAEQRLSELEEKVTIEKQAHEELAKKAVPGSAANTGDFSTLLGISSPVPAMLAPKLRQLHEFANELRVAIASANAAAPGAANQSQAAEPGQNDGVGEVDARKAEEEHDDLDDEDEDMPSGDEEESPEILGGEDAIAAFLRPQAKRRKGQQGSSVASAATEATLE